MIFHASIPAADPKRVALVIAALWRADVTEFPPYDGSYVVLAGDDRNSLIEVYPLGGELYPTNGIQDAEMRTNPNPSRATSTHLAIASPLKEKEIHALAEREGWTAKTLSRGGLFHVIEFWLENAVMLEVLTRKMQKEYLAGMTTKKWRAYLEAATAQAAA